MAVKTRFAPSPTGLLHVGGVRTALFCWLYAKAHQGQFILRIEDTDDVRSTDESVNAILEGMAWLGLDYDEEPFYQSKRLNRYHKLAQQLQEQGQAYYCTCSKERLETLRDAQLQAKEKPRYDNHCRDKNLAIIEGASVLRFKNPLVGGVSFTDQVYGEIYVDNRELDDLILIRSDGHPTYNFAVVVDDWDMNITHVIRGDDHINNTPRQINIYHALQAPLPTFAHLPMILGDDGKRLSKRHGAVSVLQFREEGVLPETLLNYLVRLGWSHGDQEIFSMTEMINYFDLNQVNRGVASFNYDKLYWLNHHYLKLQSAETVAQALMWHFKRLQIDPTNGPALKDIVILQADRCRTLADMAEKSRYFYQDDITYDKDAVRKQLRPAILAPLTRLHACLLDENNWTSESLHQIIETVCSEFNLAFGKLGQPLRVAVTGTAMSPAIDVTLALIGKARVLSRLKNVLTRLHTGVAASNK